MRLIKISSPFSVVMPLPLHKMAVVVKKPLCGLWDSYCTRIFLEQEDIPQGVWSLSAERTSTAATGLLVSSSPRHEGLPGQTSCRMLKTIPQQGRGERPKIVLPSSPVYFILIEGGFGWVLHCAQLCHPPNPLARRDVPVAQARALQFSHFSPEGNSQTVLHCAHRTSTVSSCAFCEQEGWSGCSPLTLLRPRVARAQKIIRLHPLPFFSITLARLPDTHAAHPSWR